MRSVDLVEARETAQRLLEQTARARRSVAPHRRRQGSRAEEGHPAGERDQLASCLRALASLLRDLSVLAAGGDPRLLANADLQPALRRLATAFDGDRTGRAFAAVDEALGALERNASPKVVADWLVLQL